jgi:hypothetical protein
MLLWTALGLLSLAGVGWAVKRFAFGATVAEQAGAPASAPQRGVQPAPARIASPPPQPVALPESPSPEPSATPAQRLVVKRKRVPAKPATAPSTALPSGAASAVPDPWGPELSGSRKRTAKATRSASGSLGSTDF